MYDYLHSDALEHTGLFGSLVPQNLLNYLQSDDLEQEGKERGEPGTPPMPQRMVTPIPPDTEQRNRCRLSQSPASTPRRTRQDSTGEGAGSYRKPERKRERWVFSFNPSNAKATFVQSTRMQRFF